MNRGQHVYVVEDDDAVRHSLAFALRLEGYAVTVLPDATALLNLGPAEDNAVLISDVRMPGLNGIELTRTLRRRGSILRIILITGHGDEQSIADGRQAGADGFLEKPFDPKDLVNHVERLLGAQRTVGGAPARRA